jgi:hypothetical protein
MSPSFVRGKNRRNQIRGHNKKAEQTKGFSFGSSAIFSQDPPLSSPFSRRDRLCREIHLLIKINNTAQSLSCQSLFLALDVLHLKYQYCGQRYKREGASFYPD